ncbi:MAG: nucleotidyltransferase family protein [Gammaproteobacteria bacterium]|nr:nucleotidyltransferase family protein [Gammaproteobacteria bacterium]MYJ73898.1 nucleotidyltransferase family protein [Gammaproteobacteria bacterium]
MGALRAVRSVVPAEECIGSGAIRNAVWDALHGYSAPSRLADVDVANFDPDDLSVPPRKRYETRLRELGPELTWDVKNQAAVHLWFHKVFGHEVEPLHSLRDAVATWPETALAVGVGLRADGTITITAPLGLEDLFSMVVRRNPRRVSVETYERRIAEKMYSKRWPRVRIVHAQGSGG